MGSITQDVLPSRLYIAGSEGGHSIAPAAHNYISKQLNKEWTMEFVQIPDAAQVDKTFRRPDFAGGVVTMPHKKTIMPYLDEVDDLAYAMGACNVVRKTSDGKLWGTNTDWVGILDALLGKMHFLRRRDDCAMVYGAGGASRAAIFTLSVKLGFDQIYILNRDKQEVADLQKDIQSSVGTSQPELIHIESLHKAKGMCVPTCIVSTVPDVEPLLPAEITCKDILTDFLSRPGATSGVLLDMCYHPRITRNVSIAQKYGWSVVEGVEVVARQLKLQWKLWTSEEISRDCEQGAIMVINQCADADPLVTPKAAS